MWWMCMVFSQFLQKVQKASLHYLLVVYREALRKMQLFARILLICDQHVCSRLTLFVFTYQWHKSTSILAFEEFGEDRGKSLSSEVNLPVDSLHFNCFLLSFHFLYQAAFRSLDCNADSSRAFSRLACLTMLNSWVISSHSLYFLSVSACWRQFILNFSCSSKLLMSSKTPLIRFHLTSAFTFTRVGFSMGSGLLNFLF